MKLPSSTSVYLSIEKEIENISTKKKKYQCDICEKEFKNNRGLKDHFKYAYNFV